MPGVHNQTVKRAGRPSGISNARAGQVRVGTALGEVSTTVLLVTGKALPSPAANWADAVNC